MATSIKRKMPRDVSGLSSGEKATARTGLGLGGASVLEVGTAAGTVAAGDDLRLGLNVNTVAELKAVNSATAALSGRVVLWGYYSKGDFGAPRIGYWDSSSTETDNGGTIFKATAITTGRFKFPALECINVRWFGAKGDGTQDDSDYIQALLTFLQTRNTGGSVFFGRGVYRITKQLLYGVKFVNESDIEGLPIDVYSAASFNNTNYVAAQAILPITLIGEAGTYIWADYAPSGTEAMLYYAGLGDRGNGTSHISEIEFAGRAAFTTGGVRVAITTQDPVANNSVGLFTPRSCVSVKLCRFTELNIGHMQADGYWTDVSQCVAYHCKKGFLELASNAMTFNTLLSYGSTEYGFIVSGSGWVANTINTQGCPVDLYIPNAQEFVVNGGYFENTESTHTDYGIKLGNTAVSTQNQVVRGTFTGIHLSRSQHKLIRAHETGFVSFTTCRANGGNSNEVKVNTSTSYLTLINTEFNVEANGNQANAVQLDVGTNGRLGISASRVYLGSSRYFYDDGTRLRISGSIAAGELIANGRLVCGGIADLTYSASISVDLASYNTFKLNVTNGTAFTINNPSNMATGQRVTFVIKNTSGGAMGTVSWGGTYKLAGSWVSPATGFRRTITFLDDGSGSLVEESRSAADIPS